MNIVKEPHTHIPFVENWLRPHPPSPVFLIHSKKDFKERSKLYVVGEFFGCELGWGGVLEPDN